MYIAYIRQKVEYKSHAWRSSAACNRMLRYLRARTMNPKLAILSRIATRICHYASCIRIPPFFDLFTHNPFWHSLAQISWLLPMLFQTVFSPSIKRPCNGSRANQKPCLYAHFFLFIFIYSNNHGQNINTIVTLAVTFHYETEPYTLDP